MYSVRPSFVLGFHGCDKSVADAVFAGKKSLRDSTNSYDWLGNGVYFWENSPERALDFARQIKNLSKLFKKKIKNPAVIGAVIDLGHCLDLSEAKNLKLIKSAYEFLKSTSKSAGSELPENKRAKKSKKLLFRHLDCAVIEMTHTLQEELVADGIEDYEYDTTRGYFIEGQKLYKDTGFCEENHIQICVRNPNCIKGFFRVRSKHKSFRIP